LGREFISIFTIDRRRNIGVAGSMYEKLEEKGGRGELGAGRIKCPNRKPYLNSATPKYQI
jgi:hypothetical protein